jgi:hydrogenase maturation protein HypF
MCPECEREYNDPKNRRFHAQPNACPKCGPGVEFRVRIAECGVTSAECGVGNAEFKGSEALRKCVNTLHGGGIVAIKGLGGFHIACDATNDSAVKKLRVRKRKSNKPFAVMCPDPEVIELFCEISDAERKILLSSIRPVVLLSKRNDTALSEAISPNNKYIGVMLPYTPLHDLLFFSGGKQIPNYQALVMTSGNLSEEPIVRDNDEAVKKLSSLVDGFLFHNRDIFMRVDDSVVRIADCPPSPIPLPERERDNSKLETQNSKLMFIRRSRGYAPDPIPLHEDGPEVLGCGADLKNTFTLTKGSFAIPSQHIGDMENYETLKFFEECLGNLKSVYRVEPVAIAHDLHPGYLSTQWAMNNFALHDPHSALPLHGIQHHYAHIGSVMAENGLKEKVIGVAFDGTGYGTDGNLWGGEFLIAGIDDFQRAGQFRYIPLPGGEAAIREPWRTAVSFVMTAAGERAFECLESTGFVGKYGQETIRQIMTVVLSHELSPLASGAGRLFDAVSALLGICDRNTFEGEAAMALEFHTREGTTDEYQVEYKKENGYTVIDFSRTILEIISDLMQGIDKGTIASKFHNTVASVINSTAKALSKDYAIKNIALSGGTFQNLYLLKRTMMLLKAAGMKVYVNQKIPCNDACVSLGQAYLVRERLKKWGMRSSECGS